MYKYLHKLFKGLSNFATFSFIFTWNHADVRALRTISIFFLSAMWTLMHSVRRILKIIAYTFIRIHDIIFIRLIPGNLLKKSSRA